MAVYSYKRVSKRTQIEKSGIERQEALIQTYLERNQLELKRGFVDLGISGFKGRNANTGALRKFLNLIATNEIKTNDILLVESFDRLTRQNGIDATKLVVDILFSKIIIVTLSDGQIYDYREDDHSSILFKINFILSRANEESRTKKDRAIGAWKKKHNEARLNNSVMTKRLPYWLVYNEENKTIELVDNRVQEVRKIYDLLEMFGAQRTATEINKTATDKKWTLIAIRHLSRAKSVYGCLEVFKTKSGQGDSRDYEEIENYYPPAISKDGFYRIQSLLDIRAETHEKKGRESKGFRNVFKGVAICQYCETALHQHFTKRKDKEYMYLICAKSLVGACSAKRKVFIPYSYIFEPFILYYKHFGFEKIIRKSGDIQELQNQYDSTLQEAKTKNAILANMTNSIEDNSGVIPKTLIKRMAEIESQIEALNEIAVNQRRALISAENTVSIETDITRSDIDSLLQTEEGRIKFNMLLKDSEVKILVKKKFEDDYNPDDDIDFPSQSKMTEVAIINQKNGFMVGYYFDRKVAILNYAKYHFYTKKLEIALDHMPVNTAMYDRIAKAVQQLKSTN